MRRNEQTIKRLRFMIVAFLAAIIVSLIVIFVVIWQVNAKTQPLSTRIKLNAYYGINDTVASSVMSGDIDAITNYGMDIALTSLDEAGIEVSQSEKEALVNKLRSDAVSLIDSGSITSDEEGRITELSKSYMANTIAGAVVYTFPDVDTEMLVDAGTTTYSRVLGIKDSLSEVKANDDLLINMQNNIDELSSSVLGSSGADSESTDYTDLEDVSDTSAGSASSSASKEKMLRALETLIEVNSYKANNSSGQSTVVYKTDNSALESANNKIDNISSSYSDLSDKQEEIAGNSKSAIDTAKTASETANSASEKAGDAAEAAKTATETANTATEIANKAKTDAASATQTVSKYYDELSQKQQEILTQIKSQLSEINSVTSRLSLEESKVSSISSDINTIDTQISALKSAISTNSITGAENIDNLESQITEVNTRLNDINQLIEATKISFQEADKKLKEDLENEIDTAVSSVSDDMNSYIKSESEYMRVSYIGPITIGTGEYAWKYINGEAMVKIYDSALEKCENVQVNYSKQYDIKPEYIVDDELGILLITVDESEATELEIGNIVIFTPREGGENNG